MKKTALAIMAALAMVPLWISAPASAAPPSWADRVAEAVEKVAPPTQLGATEKGTGRAWWARSNGYSQYSYIVGALGWDELYSKYANAGLNTNLNGMRDQYICHQVFVAPREPNKSSWNLDEWRRDVGWWETVNTYCNPGGNRWFD